MGIRKVMVSLGKHKLWELQENLTKTIGTRKVTLSLGKYNVRRSTEANIGKQ